MLMIVVIALSMIATVEEGNPKPNGTWQLTTAELGGQALPAEVVKAFKLIIDGDKYRVLSGGPEDKGELRYSTVGKNNALDIIGKEGPNLGKTMLVIYKLEGDKLTCCYDLSGKTRPTEFKSTKENKHFLAVYQRAKK